MEQTSFWRQRLGLLTLIVLVLWTVDMGWASSVEAAAHTSREIDRTRQQDAPTADDDNRPVTGLSDTFLQEYDQIVAGRSSTDAETQDESGNGGSGLASTVTVSLLLVAALAYGGVWVMRRMNGLGGTLAMGGGMLSVQESRQIGPNQKLHLVQLGEDILLLGATEQNISFLARYRTDDLPETFAEHLQSAGAGSNMAAGGALFANVLNPGPGILQESLDQLRRLRPGDGGGDD